MRCQVLSSGSGGNATLLRAGELTVLVDAGLPPRAMRARLEQAGVGYRAIDHVLVTHGHLDHSRCAGILARRHKAVVHCPERIMRNRAVSRAPTLRALHIGSESRIENGSDEPLTYLPVLLPHDCDPTVAYRVEHAGRVFAVLTDMGRPSHEVARALAGAHVLVIEFNYDEGMLRDGPYSEALKRRIAGDRGHLSNAQAQRMLAALVGPELHTIVLAHLSEKNNTPALAVEAARATLDMLGRADVEVLVASQHEVGPNLAV